MGFGAKFELDEDGTIILPEISVLDNTNLTIYRANKMDVLEQKLYPQFFRANRQFLVNRTAIKEASQHFHRKLQIHLLFPFPELILVGKEKVTQFLSWLTN